MSAVSPSSATSCLRVLRRFAALSMMLAYLLTGVLHGICDADVAHAPSGRPEIASLFDQAGHLDQQGLADHHCHGCFSVTLPQPQLAAAFVAQIAAPNWLRPTGDAGLVFDTDSPPPKHLI